MASRKDTDPDLTPHQQWRQDSINNATNPDTGEKVPTDVRAGDLADSTADQNTNTSSSSKK